MCVRLQVGQLDEVADQLETLRTSPPPTVRMSSSLGVGRTGSTRWIRMRPSCREASGSSEMTDEGAARLQAIQAGTHPKTAPASPVEMGINRFDIRAGEPHCDLQVRKLRGASDPEALDTPCTESRSPSLERQVPSAIVTLSRFPLVSTIVPPGFGCPRFALISSEKKEGVVIIVKTPILGNLDLRAHEVAERRRKDCSPVEVTCQQR